MPHESGWPELDRAMADWTSTTASLPIEFRTELRVTLTALERGEVTLVWDTRSEARAAFVERFPHPFAATYDRVMLHQTLVLGLNGPTVRMPPVGGVILRKNLGEPEAVAEEAASDPDELAILRSLLAHVTSDDVPDDEGDFVVYS